MTKLSLLPALAVLFFATACVSFEPIPFNEAEITDKANAGDAFSQTELGQHYMFSDIEKGIYWLEKAAAQDEPQALYLLGSLNEQGAMFKRNVQVAHEYYLRAAKMNNGPAQEALARIYAHGSLGHTNYKESYKWQLLADAHGWKLDAQDFGALEMLNAQEKQMAEAEALILRAQFDAL